MIRTNLLLVFALTLLTPCHSDENTEVAIDKDKNCTGDANERQIPQCRMRAIEKWFYNEKTKQCESFLFYGCFRGGEFFNSYETIEDCKKICESGTSDGSSNANGLLPAKMYFIAILSIILILSHKFSQTVC